MLEIIANEARNDAGGDYKIRIYTIGMGYLLVPPRDNAGNAGGHPQARVE